MLTIRKLDPDVDKALREKARHEGKSINALVVEILREELLPERRRRFHDLDALAGSWPPGEASRFDAVTADFSAPDKELWK